MYHLCSPHSFCVVLFVWCTVVYAHGRTYIDVSFSCLYGVPLVYARGRTRIDRALAWLGSNHLCFPHSLCVVLDVSLFVFVWCTVSVRTRSYLHWRGFMWLYGVPYVCLVYRLRSVMVVLASMALHHVCMLYRLCTHASYLHCRALLWLCGVPYVWLVYRLCSVLYSLWSVLSCLYGVPLVYARGRTYIDGLFSCVYGIPCMCCVFIMFVWCTVDVFFSSSFLYLSAVTFSCNY